MRQIRGELIQEIASAEPQISDEVFGRVAANIARAFLSLIRNKLLDPAWHPAQATLLRSGLLIIDKGEPVVNQQLYSVRFAEPWRAMLEHISCTTYNL